MGNTEFGALLEKQSAASNTIAGLRADVAYWKRIAEERAQPPARRAGYARCNVVYRHVDLIVDYEPIPDGDEWAVSLRAANVGREHITDLLDDAAVEAIEMLIGDQLEDGSTDHWYASDELAAADVPSLRESREV